MSYLKTSFLFLSTITMLGCTSLVYGAPPRPSYQPYAYEDIRAKIQDQDVTHKIFELTKDDFKQGPRDGACLALSTLYAMTHDDIFPAFWNEKIFKDHEGHYYVQSPEKIYCCLSKEFIEAKPTPLHPSRNPLLRALTGYYEICQLNELGLEKTTILTEHTICDQKNRDTLFGFESISLTREEAIQVFNGSLGLRGIFSVGKNHKHAVALFLKEGEWWLYDNNNNKEKRVTLEEFKNFSSWDMILYPQG